MSNLIVNKITIKPVTRQVTDIGLWRAALKSADRGKRSRLYNLYEDLLIDGVLSDAVEKRIDAITNAELSFQSNGESIPEIEELIDTPQFEDMLREIMLAKFWGVTVLEFTEFDPVNGFQFESIPRNHIRPDLKEILKQETDDRGISYDGDPFVVQIGDAKSLGIFLKTAPYAIFKRGGFGDWAQWIELFGLPQRIGKYSAYDPESRKLLEEAFATAGSAPSMVVPKETEVEVDNSGAGGNGTSFDEFRRACNEEMLITVLGQTMTTLDGSSRAQGEVHKEVEEGKNKSDRRFAQRVLNRAIRPLLEARGYPVKAGTFYFPEAGETISTKERLDKDMQLIDIIDIDEEYFYETYDIPKPDKKAKLAKRKTSGQTAPQEEQDEEEEIKNSDRGWYKRMFDFFVEAPAAMTGAIEYLTKNLTASKDPSAFGNITLADDPITDIIDLDGLFNKAIKNIYTGSSELSQTDFDKNLYDLNNKPLQSGLNKTFAAAGTNWNKQNAAFANEFKTNTAVFAAFKAHEEGRKIAELLTLPDGSIRPWSDFKKEALKIDAEWNKAWLQTEYTTAVRAARMAVNWRKFLETERLYPNLEYTPSRAANPRESHVKFYGTILPLRHPFWKKRMPPSEWGCMCGVRATDKPVTAPPEGWEDLTDPVFANNPGETAEFVNIRETSYYKSAAEAAREDIERKARVLQAEAIKLETEYKRKKFKSGGELHTPANFNQYKHEAKKNVKTYTLLAKEHGYKYKLLNVFEGDRVKNPDAFNITKGVYSDAKDPKTLSGKNAIQNSIKKASEQSTPEVPISEVVIHMEHQYTYIDILRGFKAALQPGRAKNLKTAIIIYADGNIKRYDLGKLRQALNKKQRR